MLRRYQKSEICIPPGGFRAELFSAMLSPDQMLDGFRGFPHPNVLLHLSARNGNQRSLLLSPPCWSHGGRYNIMINK